MQVGVGALMPNLQLSAAFRDLEPPQTLAIFDLQTGDTSDLCHLAG